MLSITYASVNSGKTNVRQVGPHFLYFAKGSLYLVAEDLNDRIVKVFSVARIQSAEMMNDAYLAEPVDPEAYFSNSFGVYHGNEAKNIVIRFAPEVSSFVKERRWHQSQRIINKEGGTIEFHIETDITPELIQWILGFGSHAQVLEPKILAEKIVSEAHKIITIYQEIKTAI